MICSDNVLSLFLLQLYGAQRQMAGTHQHVSAKSAAPSSERNVFVFKFNACFLHETGKIKFGKKRSQ